MIIKWSSLIGSPKKESQFYDQQNFVPITWQFVYHTVVSWPICVSIHEQPRLKCQIRGPPWNRLAQEHNLEHSYAFQTLHCWVISSSTFQIFYHWNKKNFIPKELGLAKVVPVWYRTTDSFIPPLSNEVYILSFKLWQYVLLLCNGSRLEPIGSKTLSYHGCSSALWEGEIPCFQHFVWIRPPADADCVISIAYKFIIV